MTDKNLTEVITIIDRSGSMGSVRDETISGFNVFLKEQQELPGRALLTMVQFDDQYELVHNAVDIKEVPPLNEDTYVPRGMTALLDAVGKTINNVGDRLRSIPEPKRPKNIIFFIITDGYENSSREFNRSKIKEMIAHQEDKYSWNFSFMGANMDAFEEGASLGINARMCCNFDADSKGARAVYYAASDSLRSLRTSGVIGSSMSASYASAADRVEEEDNDGSQ